MFSRWSKKESSRGENRPSSRNSFQSDAQTTSRGGIEKKGEMETTTITEESGPSSITLWKDGEPMIISGQKGICSVTFLGSDIISGGEEGKVRRWSAGDGGEVGTPMAVGDTVLNIALSRDGEWIVSGSRRGMVTVWKAKTHEKVTEFKAHGGEWVSAVDVSPDGTRIVTGGWDFTASVWSLSTGERLLGPWHHKNGVVAAKFSPDGRLIATAHTYDPDSVRIYDARNGHLLVDVAIRVLSIYNNSLAWTINGKQLYALSDDNNIRRLNASTGKELSRWAIHTSNDNPQCIALSSNDALIAASCGRSVSLWDTKTRQQIGSVFEYTHTVECMAISHDFCLVTGGGERITLCTLYGMLPPQYLDTATITQIVQKLRIQFAETQRACQEKDDLIQSLRVQEESSSSTIAQLSDTVQDLRGQLTLSQHSIDEQNETVKLLWSDLRAHKMSSNNIITQLEEINRELQHKVDGFLRIIRAHEQKHQCESLYSQGCIRDAAESLLGMMNTLTDDVKADKLLSSWLVECTQRCVKALEKIGNDASNAKEQGEALSAYSVALSLSSLTPNTILRCWASIMLNGRSVSQTLRAAAKFKVPRSDICRTMCDILEVDGRVMEAAECFREMRTELPIDGDTHDERAEWEVEFQERCINKLVKLGDTAQEVEKDEEAVRYYSIALSLDPKNVNDVLLKRSNGLIALDPSSHVGYEGRYTALNGINRYSEAFEAFRMMISKLEESSDPGILKLRQQYLDITPLIKTAVEQTISTMPRILIDTATGRLYDKIQQAAVFEKLSIYDKLRCSMTTRSQLDYSIIQDEVKKFYRYVMFSHRWDFGEPLFQTVQNISVYELERSVPHVKLQTFCRIIRALGFQWVWSDTCCIDKKDNVVLQESLVAMFTWYRGSSLTLVYLRGVWSHSQKPGDLRGSIWNTRAWTYQEYVAAETVQFYTEDWKPYLGLEMFNHKEAHAVISEMEEASGVSARQLSVIRPGLDRVREKLFLASSRQTTLNEDIAYSLLGIFNASIPVIYGEGNRAVGRLLEHVLTGSGDVSILAWTGRAGGYNSCLPADLTVYNQVIPPHIPQPIEVGEMDRAVATLRSPFALDPSLLRTLYHRLQQLPPPFMAASRLRVSGIVFSLTELAYAGSDAETRSNIYRATSTALGVVEIRTTDSLADIDEFILVHPWISPLLDQEFSRRAVGLDETTRALHLFARLKQEFGALLLVPLSRVQYKRVATDSLIMVRIREEIELSELMDGIRTVDIQ